MCWQIALPDGVQAVLDDMYRAIVPNDEGFGMAWFDEGGHLSRMHMMDGKMAVRMFGAVRRQWPAGPAVFHARLATTGVVCPQECHPISTPDGHYAVFLNGTLDIPLNGKTDTRAFTEDFLPQLNLDDELDRAAIEVMCRKTNAKVVILTDDPARAEQAYIFNQDQWIVTPYGGLASNADHKGGPAGRGQGTGWDECTVAGDLLRWRILQDGQCPGCHLYGCERGCAPSDPPAYRNETERRERVRQP